MNYSLAFSAINYVGFGLFLIIDSLDKRPFRKGLSKWQALTVLACSLIWPILFCIGILHHFIVKET